MKKTLTINLGGVVFHIEDDAYYALDTYLEGLKKKFATDPDRDEIIQDIEQRIAEIFRQNMKKADEPVTFEMVEEAKQTLGSANDIADEEEEIPHASKSNNGKRLYRDSEKGVFGGVCAGLSPYMNIDLTLLRIIFVVLLFASSFTFFFVYLVLWIAVPEALSTSQRMEMKGEPVNITSIEKKVKDKQQNPPKEPTKKKPQSKGTTTGETILKVFAWIVIGFFVLIILIVTLSLLAALFGLTIASSVLSSFLPEVFIGADSLSMQIPPDLIHHTAQSVIGLILFVGAPVILILFIISKVAFKHNGKVGWVIFLSAVLWFVGIGMIATSGLRWIDKATGLDVEVIGNDDDGAIVIGGDTIVRYSEDFNDKFNLKVKSRRGKLEIDESKNSISFTTNLDQEDTMIIARPADTFKKLNNRDEYVWVEPEYRIINADVDQVTIFMELFEYSYSFEKFKLRDPAFRWDRDENRLVLPDKVGMKKGKDDQKVPVIILKVPEKMTVRFEDDSDELFENLTWEQKERIENDSYYKMTESEFYLAN